MKKNEEKFAIIIQSRLSSKRFPGKMMKNLDGIPLVEYVYKRCRQSAVRKICVAIPDDTKNDRLYRYCQENNLAVMRGDSENVLKRYKDVADAIGAEYILRVCGDTPFVDIFWGERFLERLAQEGLDYAAFERSRISSAFYCEAISLNALIKISSLELTKEEKEHVTPYIINHREDFKTYFADIDVLLSGCGDLRLTVDYPEDLKVAHAIARRLENKFNFTSEDVIKLAQQYTKGLL